MPGPPATVPATRAVIQTWRGNRPEARTRGPRRVPRRAPPPGWPPVPANGPLQMNDGARQRAGDAGHQLHVADDHLAQLVHVAGLGEHHDVVGTGDGIDTDHSGQTLDRQSHLARLADLRLDQDVRLYHDTTPSSPRE